MEPLPGEKLGPDSTNGITPDAFVKAADFRREAQDRTRRLFASHSDLRAILERHEATIQKRWIKKTKSQRQAILLKAWPNMATSHRPDLEALKKEARGEGVFDALDQKYRDSFIWPYINQEDLSKPKALPLLLNSRGRHNPCDFAAADGEVMRLAICVGIVGFSYITQHVMILNGAVGPDEYGKILALDDHPDALDWLSSRKQFTPSKGLVILEAQERLLGFLVSCCRQILHEIPDQTLTSDAFSIKPPPQLRTEADSGGFNSLAIMAAEAPYRVPEHLDFGRIESLLAARASAADDHMWSLREDPGYFADMQKEAMEHRQEMIKDGDGKPHPLLDKSRIEILWRNAIGSLVVEAFIPLEIFSDLQRQAQDLQALQEKYASAISPVVTLPKEYLQAILQFRYDLIQAARGYSRQLKACATASPALRRFLVRSDASPSTYTITSKPDMKMEKYERELIWLLSTLWEDEERLFSVRLPMVIDELQRLLDSEPKAKELVSPYVAGIIGGISIISQCITQIELYQPWANGFEIAMAEYGDDIKNHFSKKTAQRVVIYETIKKNLGQALKLDDLLGGRYAYPLEKRRTKENVEVLRQSEASVDAFWASVDELMRKKVGDLKGTAVLRLLSQPRVIQRTPEWVEPIKEPKKVETVPNTGQDVEALYKPLSALYFGVTPSKTDVTDGNLTKTKTKTKTKTRGTAKAVPTAVDGNSLEDQSPPDPQPTLAVDARALKVFRTLFYNPSTTSTPGEVSWNDFLHALTSTGFAAEKLYGSVWQFRPAALNVDRCIQFHEPHPSGKIPFRVARRHGRRLNRAYGWSGDVFRLKEKNVAGEGQGD